MLQVGGISIDITDRKLAESKLKESEELFRKLADAMPQIVWTANPAGDIDYFNQRWYAYTGATEQAAWEELVHRTISRGAWSSGQRRYLSALCYCAVLRDALPAMADRLLSFLMLFNETANKATRK